MCLPASAALLLAALTALPCRGIDADGGTKVPKQNHQIERQPTNNELYIFLHKHNFSEIVDKFRSHSYIEKFNEENGVKYLYEDKAINEIHLEGVIDLRKERPPIMRVINKRALNINKSGERLNEAKSLETTTISVLRVSPLVLERRRKPGEVGSSAPLLNYIFDTYTNTHEHRNEKVGNGNSIYAAAETEVEALVGSTAHLDCKVDSLHDKLVSWVRRKSIEDPMVLLTTGTQQYTADERYSAKYIPPDIWRLEVKEVRPSDAAHYECHLSAHPPRAARVTLHVPDVSIRVVDGAGAEVSEQVCEIGSTVALRCEVRGLRMEGGPSLLWYRRDMLLNDDTTRGGISVRTEFGPNGANSVLRVARVRGDDAGKYTCTVARSPPPAPPPAHVLLHIVVKGESLAELHQGNAESTFSVSNQLMVVLTPFIIYKGNFVLY